MTPRLFRPSLLLALAVALLGAYLFTWDRDDDASRAERFRVRTDFRFNPARIEEFQLERGGRLLACRRSAPDAWTVTAPISAPADKTAVDRLLAALRDLASSAAPGALVLPARPDDPAAYAPYGLDPPAAVLSVREDHAVRRLLVGRRSPLGDGTYARIDGRPGIARIPDTFLDALPPSADALRDRTLLRGAPGSFDRIDVRSPSGYLQLSRGPDSLWLVHRPVPSRADSAAVTAFLDSLLSASVLFFVQDNVSDFSPFGLDARSALVLILNGVDSTGSQVLSVGDPVPHHPDAVYARLQSSTSVYAVPAALRALLSITPDDLRDRSLPGLSDPDAVLSFRIASAGRSLAASRDPSDPDSWRLTAPFEAPADPAAIRALLRTFTAVRLTAFPEPPPPTARAPKNSRTLSITLRDAPAPFQYTLSPPPKTAAPTNAPASPDPADPAAQPAPPTLAVALPAENLYAIASPDPFLTLPLDPAPYLSLTLLTVPPDDIDRLEWYLPSDAPAPIATHRRLPDGSWSPHSTALPPLLPLLAPLTALRHLPFTSTNDTFPQPSNAQTDQPSNGQTVKRSNGQTFPSPAPAALRIRLRGASGIAHTLLFSRLPEPAPSPEPAAPIPPVPGVPVVPVVPASPEPSPAPPIPAALQGRPGTFLLPAETAAALLQPALDAATPAPGDLP